MSQSFLISGRVSEPAMDNLLPAYKPTAKYRKQLARWNPGKSSTAPRKTSKSSTGICSLLKRPLKLPNWAKNDTGKANKVLIPTRRVTSSAQSTRNSSSRTGILDPRAGKEDKEPDLSLHQSFSSRKLGTTTQLAQMGVPGNRKIKTAVGVQLSVFNKQDAGELDLFVVSSKSAQTKCSTLKPGQLDISSLGRCDIMRVPDSRPVSAARRQRLGLTFSVLSSRDTYPRVSNSSSDAIPDNVCTHGPTTLKFSNLKEETNCILYGVLQDGSPSPDGGRVVGPGCHVLVDAAAHGNDVSTTKWRLYDCDTRTEVEVSLGQWAQSSLQTFQIAWTPESRAASRLSFSSKNAELSSASAKRSPTRRSPKHKQAADDSRLFLTGTESISLALPSSARPQYGKNSGQRSSKKSAAKLTISCVASASPAARGSSK